MGDQQLTGRKYAEADGHRIAYYQRGDGPPMLLIHGITTYSFLWKEMLPALAEHFDVIALDLLGCGDSEKPLGADVSLNSLATGVVSFMDALGIEKAHIVAHDIGGGIGQIMAVKTPDRLLSLTLINSVGYDLWPVQPIKALRIPVLKHLGMAALDIGMLKVLINKGFYHKKKADKDLISQFRRPLMTYEGRQGFLNLAKCLDNRNLTDITDRFGEIDLPVLIIWGTADVYLKFAIAERLNRDIPGSRLLEVPTAGHYGPLDEPEIMAGGIIKFLAGVGVADTA